jgi:hypothetical protein
MSGNDPNAVLGMSFRRRPIRLLICLGALAALPVSSARAATDVISTVAGDGIAGFAGDGGPASTSRLNFPIAVVALPDGGYVIADQVNHRVRRVAPDGTINTIAGRETDGYSGDGGPATQARLSAPTGVARTADGGFLIADANNNAIRRVAPDGTITTVAGTGAAGFSGDGGAATLATLRFPSDVAVTPDGGYLIADTDNQRIRKVLGGTITTVAGTGGAGFNGDGSVATTSLYKPGGVAPTADGGFLIADDFNRRVRKVLGGQVTTVAGNGGTGSTGDGGPATAAEINVPVRVAVAQDGGYLIAERDGNRVRSVSAGGTISTVAGTGTAGFSGDGGPAAQAELYEPSGVSFTAAGDALIADVRNHRIRRIHTDTGAPRGEQPPNPPPGPGPGTSPPPAPPAPPPPPAPRFEVLGDLNPDPDRTILIDARTSQNVETYNWDVTGDGNPDVECPEGQGILGLSAAEGGPTRLQLTGVGGGQTVISSGQTIEIPSYIDNERYTLGMPDIAVCTRTEAIYLRETECTEATINWLLMAARGCFIHSVHEKDVPKPEAAVARQHYTYGNFSDLVRTICNQVALGNAPPSRCEDAKKFFSEKAKLDFYVSKEAISLNGVEITPAAGASVVVFPALERVISSKATMRWGDFKILGAARPIDLNLEDVTTIRSGPNLDPDGAAPNGKTAPLFDFDGKSLPAIGGFRIDGSVSLALEGIDGKRRSTATFKLRAPNVLSLFGGNPPSAEVILRASTTRSPHFEDLDLQIPEADIGAVRFTQVRFRYAENGGISFDGAGRRRCSRKEWEAQANVFIAGGKPNPDGSPGQTGFLLAPPPSENGLGFCDGAFTHAGGAIVFGGPIPKPQLFPGLFLDEINFGIRVNPFLVRGGGQVSIADIAKVRGTLLVAYASPAKPFVLSAADAGRELEQIAGRRFYGTTIAGGGAVSMVVPGFGDRDLGSMAVYYSYPDYFGGNGSVDLIVPGFRVYGGGGIEASVSTKKFQAGFAGGACLAGVKDGLCLGAEGNITSKGIVACLNVFDELHPGAGLIWGEVVPTIWLIDGCAPSGYWVDVRAAKARAAGSGDGLTFTVAQGEGVKNIRLAGVGAAPLVRLTAPDGETIDVVGTDFVRAGGLAGLRETKGGFTYLAVKDGKPGTYRITKLPDSAPFGALSATRPGYDTNFTANVTGSGATRTLEYDARKPGRQEVTFYEKGAGVMQRLTTSKGGTGKLRFKPAPGPGGKREIVAEATVDGVPIPAQTVASYRWAGTPRTGRPGRVTVKRRGKTLTIRWTAATGAAQYGVVVDQGKIERRFRVGAGRRSLTVRGVPLTDGGVARVSALGAFQDWGPARKSKRFKALAAPPSVLQDARHNQRLEDRAAIRRR